MSGGNIAAAAGAVSHKLEWQSAYLCADATVGRASEKHLTGIAASAVAHAKGAVDEGLESHLRHGLVYGTYVIDGEFAREHRLFVAVSLAREHVGSGAVVHLCGSMNGYLAVGQQSDARVLDDERIHAYIRQRVYHGLRVSQLIVTQEGVYGDIDTHSEHVCIGHEAPDVGHGIACRGTCAEARCPDIYGVGAMLDGLYAAGDVACRCQQLNVSH